MSKSVERRLEVQREARMNKEDQAGFFKWYISDDVLPRFCDYDSGDVEEVWHAACAYKQKRIKELEDSLEAMRNISAAKTKAWMKQDKLIMELEAENHKARELIDDLIQAALNDCVESIEWGEVEERARAFLINQSEEGKDD